MAKPPYPPAAQSERQSAQGCGQERQNQERGHRQESAGMLRRHVGRCEPHHSLSHDSGRKPEKRQQPEAVPPEFPVGFHPPVCTRSIVNSREWHSNGCKSPFATDSARFSPFNPAATGPANARTSPPPPAGFPPSTSHRPAASPHTCLSPAGASVVGTIGCRPFRRQAWFERQRHEGSGTCRMPWRCFTSPTGCGTGSPIRDREHLPQFHGIFLAESTLPGQTPELALKALIMCSTGSSPKGHDLLDLFNRLPENMRRRVERRTQPEPARRAAAPAQAPQCGRRDRFKTGALSVMIDEFRGQDG